MTQPHPKAFAIWFKDLERWDAGYFRQAQWKWPKEVIRPLKSVLERRIEPVTTTVVGELPIIEKITFGGVLSIRAENERKGYKGRLFWAYPGDLIYSKIRVKQGSMTIIPDVLQSVAVSSEYPVFEIKREIAEPAYLSLVFRSSAFLKLLDGFSHGGSSKTRIHPDNIENIEIPFPPLETQRAIVRRWQEGQVEAERLETMADLARDKIETILTDALGLKPVTLKSKPKAFAVSWRFVDRWSASYNLSKLSVTNLESGKFPVSDLGALLDVVQYGTSGKANTREEGTPILRMSNIKDGVLDFSNLEHIKLPAKERDRLLLRPDDILFNRTNSRELVGKCAVFRAEGRYVFASYCIRVRPKFEVADSDYLAIFINSTLGREQITSLMRPIIGQANINSEEIRSLQIPLPPLETQREIVRQVQAVRSEAARLRAEAAKLRRDTKEEVERLILGTESVFGLV